MDQTMIPVDELSTIFSDLAPIPQDDGPEPVCVIQYPTSFVLAYNYMRAVWKSNEFSGMYDLYIPFVDKVEVGTRSIHCKVSLV